jgi:hypothetical protein
VSEAAFEQQVRRFVENSGLDAVRFNDLRESLALQALAKRVVAPRVCVESRIRHWRLIST